MRIRGGASGTLTMEADGVALADFLTNRTGFVILHAAEVAGGRMDLVHTDGRCETSSSPLLISADQPCQGTGARLPSAPMSSISSDPVIQSIWNWLLLPLTTHCVA